MLTLLGNDLELELHETHFMGPDTKVIVENETGIHFIDAPDIQTYHGKVVGKENSRVAMTIYDNLLIGMIDVDDNPYYIDLTKEAINGKTVHAVYRDDAIIVDNTFGDAICGVEDDLIGSTQYKLPSFEEIMVPLSLLGTTQIDILPCYDRDFKDIYGSYGEAEADIADMINTVNLELANHDVELNFNYYKRYSYLDDDTAQSIFDFFEDDIPPYRDMTDSDLTTLFYGDDFTDIVIGLGSVFNGSSDRAYSVVQMAAASGTSYGATYPERCILLTHEFGHNFGTLHGEAYTWNISGIEYYTAMKTPFTYNSTNKMRNIYSDGDIYGDSTHNNSEYIVNDKDAIAAFRTP